MHHVLDKVYALNNHVRLITRVNGIIVCVLLVCVHAAFCENNFKNVGIILRIIGEFKKNFRKEQLENLKA